MEQGQGRMGYGNEYERTHEQTNARVCVCMHVFKQREKRRKESNCEEQRKGGSKGERERERGQNEGDRDKEQKRGKRTTKTLSVSIPCLAVSFTVLLRVSRKRFFKRFPFQHLLCFSLYLISNLILGKIHSISEIHLMFTIFDTLKYFSYLFLKMMG